MKVLFLLKDIFATFLSCQFFAEKENSNARNTRSKTDPLEKCCLFYHSSFQMRKALKLWETADRAHVSAEVLQKQQSRNLEINFTLRVTAVKD